MARGPEPQGSRAPFHSKPDGYNCGCSSNPLEEAFFFLGRGAHSQASFRAQPDWFASSIAWAANLAPVQDESPRAGLPRYVVVDHAPGRSPRTARRYCDPIAFAQAFACLRKRFAARRQIRPQPARTVFGQRLSNALAQQHRRGSPCQRRRPVRGVIDNRGALPLAESGQINAMQLPQALLQRLPSGLFAQALRETRRNA